MNLPLRRVAVTGIGLVTPLGVGTRHTWGAVCDGRSGITRLSSPEFDDYHITIGGQVKNTADHLDLILSHKEQRKTDRFSHLALLAAREALMHAEFPDFTDEERFKTGVYAGIGMGGLGSIVDSVNVARSRGFKRVSPYLIPRAISNEAASLIAIAWDLHGPALSVNSACSSGADAIGQAFRAIQSGAVDGMIAGGAESVLTPLALSGFGNMRALSTWQGDPAGASRPFSADRSGFVLAEGAGMLLLEEWDRARSRGATIYAEIVGYAATCDAYHTTAIHPEGRGGVQAIKSSLMQAHITPEHVGYINAHGTGTKMNDAIESMIVRKSLGQHADNGLLMSSTKSMTGHMMGAAGGVEVGLSALALYDRIAPPTINLDAPDPECTLDYVAGAARELSTQYALSNSFGFGGSNVTIALRAVD